MDQIKESFDTLPIAVCFFDANGVVRLVNHQMLSLMNHLRKDGIQTLNEMDLALQSPPHNISCLSPQLHTYRFPDGRIVQFEKQPITTKEGQHYTQVSAADVTELIKQQATLKEENEKLADANQRLRNLYQQMPEMIREEETLAIKMQVHDSIGHSILAARRVLHRQADLAKLKETAALWEQSIAVLYRSNQMQEKKQPVEEEIQKAGKMGIRVLLEGDRFRTSPELIALAIRECASNCVRHADGTELYVHIQQELEQETLIFSNNGTPPTGQIAEGGGLSMLRYHIEKAGGKMQLQSIPCFQLILALPLQEEPL